KEKEPTQKKTNTSSKAEKQEDEPAKDETADWVSATTQGGVFSMRVPDGWSMTNYPNDFLGTTGVTYKAGTTATVESSDTEYRGHSLRFRASVTALDDTGLGPQWSSPQPGLTETTEDFSIGSLTGKRYKGDFTGDLNQTLYEYVFDLGNSKKLDIVYTVNHASGDVDGVATVEKAIKTSHLNN
ncbi:MAG TPA: hypothetical protein VLA92_02235, partial [Candidatus Saccharimonadales bacterium]|nr:hypothetical protein [Candidatus Saccharimonadales bacterium]